MRLYKDELRWTQIVRCPSCHEDLEVETKDIFMRQVDDNPLRFEPAIRCCGCDMSNMIEVDLKRSELLPGECVSSFIETLMEKLVEEANVRVETLRSYLNRMKEENRRTRMRVHEDLLQRDRLDGI